MPSPLIGAALALWGLQNDLLLLGVALAAAIEVARFVRWRWDLGDTDFNRLADVTAIAFVIVGLYQFDSHAARGIYGMLRWMPVLLFPLLAAQIYSTRDRIGYAALFISVRRALAKGSLREAGTVDFKLPFFVVCLVSAGGARVDADVYLPAAGALVVLALWLNRPSNHRRVAAVASTVAACAVAWAGVEGVVVLRRAVEPMLMDYFQERILAYRDPYRAYTAMGHIGRLKLSDRIVLRVTPSPGQPPPPLLREGMFQTLTGNVWIAGGGKFSTLTPSADGTVWMLGEAPDRFRRTTISRHMTRGKGLIPVPLGTHRIDELPVEDLLRNRLGTLKVLAGPELVEYHVRHRPGSPEVAPPAPADRAVPAGLQPLIDEVAAEVGIEPGREPRASLAAIQDHFREGFGYAVTLRRPLRGGSPLEAFLKHTRVGHCEFFASATVLLLRAAGIPARYATGYAVSEWSELEQRYVVRRRHAHSWAMAYLDGRWVDVDTTPGQWAAIEAEEQPWWGPGYDFLSWLRFRYAQWRWLGTEEGPGVWLLWLGVPLVLYLAWRLATSKRVTRGGGGRAHRAAAVAPVGLDSELLRAMRGLGELGLPAQAGESLRSWLDRLRASGRLPPELVPDASLVELHYRHRFDPKGLSAEERDTLHRGALAWMSRVEERLSQTAGTAEG